MNKLELAIKEFEKKNALIAKKFSSELMNRIGKITDSGKVGKIISEVSRKYGLSNAVEETLLNGVAESVNAAVKGGAKATILKKWYLEKAYSPSGSKFSKELYSAVDIKEMTGIIKKSLKAADTWRETAKKLADTRIPKVDVAKDIQSIVDRARTAYKLSGDSEAYKEYKIAIKRVQKRIDRLVDQDTSRLKAAYQDILDLTNKSSVAQIDRAVKYASYYKQRYNAESVARTEMAKAYGDASFTDAIHDQDCIGVQFTLSSNHPVEDICDMITGADMYGMGKGVYPTDSSPQYPFHVNCRCQIGKVYERETIEANAKDFNPKAINNYLKDATPSETKQVLDNMGVNRVPKNAPSAWVKKPIIPKKVLYGK